MVVPQAEELAYALGLSALFPQGKNYRNINNFVNTIIPDSINESTESGRILGSPAPANVAPAVFCTIKSANVSVSHDRKR